MHALPTAIAFRNASDGAAAVGDAVELTSDGGRTWRVVFRAPRAVLAVSFDAGGRLRWRTAPAATTQGPCARFDRRADSGAWVLCIGQGGAGEGWKTVYRRTPSGPARCGRLSRSGYAEGISMAPDGFGLVWESRGTLYVTRDGCAHWTALPRVAVPELDFGIAGAALPHGVAFVLLQRDAVHDRLLETTDGGRSWHVVHRWDG
jgi:hypothetical protein